MASLYKKAFVPLAVIASSLAIFAACSSSKNSALKADASTDGIIEEKSIFTFGLDGTKTVALTFDDGPSEFTPQLLDYLKSEGIHATFFIIGNKVEGQEDTLKREASEGHIMGNHTWDHTDLRDPKFKADPQALIEELDKADQVISPFLSPMQKRKYFRAPGGTWKPFWHFAEIVNSRENLSRYVGPVYWNIGGALEMSDSGEVETSADWNCWSKNVAIDKCGEGYVGQIEKAGGGVTLMHDRFGETVEMVKIIVPQLKAKGYKFITLEEIPDIQAAP